MRVRRLVPAATLAALEVPLPSSSPQIRKSADFSTLEVRSHCALNPLMNGPPVKQRVSTRLIATVAVTVVWSPWPIVRTSPHSVSSSAVVSDVVTFNVDRDSLSRGPTVAFTWFKSNSSSCTSGQLEAPRPFGAALKKRYAYCCVRASFIN